MLGKKFIECLCRVTYYVDYLIPGVGLDLRELELSVVGVHLSYLLLGGRPEDLDDLHQLVDSTVTWEDGLAQ